MTDEQLINSLETEAKILASYAFAFRLRMLIARLKTRMPLWLIDKCEYHMDAYERYGNDADRLEWIKNLIVEFLKK